MATFTQEVIPARGVHKFVSGNLTVYGVEIPTGGLARLVARLAYGAYYEYGDGKDWDGFKAELKGVLDD